MILNLLSDDGFLSIAVSALIQDIGIFKFIVTPTTNIPFGAGESDTEVIYLIDGRMLKKNMDFWLINGKNHHIVFLTLTAEQKNRWKTVGLVFDISGSVRMVRNTIKNILLSTLSEGCIKGADHSPLTKRESEVYNLLKRGWSIYKIADYLNCSPKTVYAHRSKIVNKKGAKRFYNLHKEIDSHFG